MRNVWTLSNLPERLLLLAGMFELPVLFTFGDRLEARTTPLRLTLPRSLMLRQDVTFQIRLLCERSATQVALKETLVDVSLHVSLHVVLSREGATADCANEASRFRVTSADANADVASSDIGVDNGSRDVVLVRVRGRPTGGGVLFGVEFANVVKVVLVNVIESPADAHVRTLSESTFDRGKN